MERVLAGRLDDGLSTTKINGYLPEALHVQSGVLEGGKGSRGGLVIS